MMKEKLDIFISLENCITNFSCLTILKLKSFFLRTWIIFEFCYFIEIPSSLINMVLRFWITWQLILFIVYSERRNCQMILLAQRANSEHYL